MNELTTEAKKWLHAVIGVDLSATKHAYSNQDEVYKIVTANVTYYLKVSQSLATEHENLLKLKSILLVPEVIGFYQSDEKDYLLLSALPGKNLAELVGEWSNEDIVTTFARAVRDLHATDVHDIFHHQTSVGDVLLHGDIAMPNIIVHSKDNIGYIDFGKLSFGAADSDIADAIWSVQRNVGSGYGKLFLESYGTYTMTPKIQAALDFIYKG